jgi:aminopeptidase N
VDVPITVLSKQLKHPAYRYNAYIKAAYFYDMLRNVLGEDKFHKFLSGYMLHWNGKHPVPQDFFNLLNSTAGENLDWLINPWFYNFGYFDLSVKEVKHTGNGYKITVAKNGTYPGQFKLELLYSDGTKEVINESASVWKNGNSVFTLKKTAAKKIIKVRLFDNIWLDADSSNDEYTVK